MIIGKGEEIKVADSGRPAGDRPPVQPAPVLEIGGDAFKGSAGPAPTEGERLKAAVDAAKVAQGSRPAPPPPAETPWQQFLRGLLGRVPAGGRTQPKAPGFLDRFKGFASGFARHFASDHPVSAIARTAIRIVPVAGVLVGAADVRDIRTTLQDPKATSGQKVLAGVKALAGVATIGAGGLLVTTGAAAFLPYLFAAGAVAGIADVALSRWRRGRW